MQDLKDWSPVRQNRQRQGKLQCGFFVMHWMEEEVRACSGEGFCSRGRCEIRAMKASVLKLLSLVLPVEQKLQKTLEALEAPPPAETLPPPPPPSGAPEAAGDEFRMEDYSSPDDWAAAVMPTLQPSSQEAVSKAMEKELAGIECGNAGKIRQMHGVQVLEGCQVLEECGDAGAL